MRTIRGLNESMLAMGLLALLSFGISFAADARAIPRKPGPPPLVISGLTSNDLNFTPHKMQKLAGATVVEIINDPAFKKPTQYRAVPFRSLISGVSLDENSTVEFECFDGYHAVLDMGELINAPEVHQPYVAYALADGRRIGKNSNGKMIGPYFLVWPTPKDGIVKEANWPFNLKAFRVIKKSFKEQYPGLYPRTPIADSELKKKVEQGLELFRTNCFVCHWMNGNGKATIGAMDLKVSGLLKQWSNQEVIDFVRDPGKLMPGTAMSAFSEKMLSKEDLLRIITYLRHMQSE